MSEPQSLQKTALPDLADSLRDHLMSGGALGDWIGVGRVERAAADALARYFYQQDQFDLAAQMFLWLIAMEPFERTYLQGLGSVRMMQQRYPEAVDQFAAALALDIEDPYPSFLMAQCLLKMGLRDPARDALSICLAYSTRPEQSELRARAQALADLFGTASESTGALARQDP